MSEESDGSIVRAQSSSRAVEILKARSRISRHGSAALLAMLVPAVLFPLGLILLVDDPRFPWLSRLADCPWEFWGVALCGSIASLGGLADWRIHRSGTTVVGKREHRAHVVALGGGGIPLFLLMAIASFNPRPVRLLLPVLVVLIFTVVLICYDEFIFHRRCGRIEMCMHRILTFGNGLAFLAWAHWCFVRGGSMPETLLSVETRGISWRSLLSRAAELYDMPGSPLAQSAGQAGRHGFRSGAAWMAQCMEILRGAPLEASSAPRTNFQVLGLLKYGAACMVAMGWAFAAFWVDTPILVILSVPLFYAVEAQGVFLFPVALDGYAYPFRTARRWTLRAGGTLRVMIIVMPIAVTMLGGGFVGRGFLRSWCLGCLAICIWHERLRADQSGTNFT